MTKRIDRVDVRAALEPQREPYWVRVDEGRYLGFRKLSAASPGNWVARYYAGDRKYSFEALGDFKDLDQKARYGAAKKAAEKWFEHLKEGGSPDTTTVKGACEAYVTHLETHEPKKRARTPEQKEAAAAEAKARFERLVYSDPIAMVDLSKLTVMQVSGWKKRVMAKHGHRGSFNRNAVAVRAALNLALKTRAVISNFAWIEELKPFEDADGSRTLTLTREERRLLIEKASTEARPLIRAMAGLPLRPGDLAKLTVAHFDARRSILSVPAGKTKSREIPLSGEALAIVKNGVEGKLPAAWIFSRADGGQWNRFAWREHINDAAKAAKLPEAVCAYTLRHSAITDLMVSGLDLFHVARMAGTSMKMIEENYGHLRDEQTRKGFAVLSLKE